MANPTFMHSRRPSPIPISAPLLLMATFLTLLWIAGGASREDALGQVVVRVGACLIIAAAAVLGPKPVWADIKPVAVLLLAATALPIFQLIPLPPEIWQALPGRDILIMAGEDHLWRPITMAPGATRNALFSLLVPLATLLLLAQTTQKERAWLAPSLLAVITSAVFLGLLQFSGIRFNNPLINDVAGNVGSIFANRNHFALLVAIGCLLAPVWALSHREGLQWRAPIAAGLMLLFIMTILAVGSRSGLLLTALALVVAMAAIGKPLQRRAKRIPRSVFVALVGIGLIVVAGFIWASFVAGRVEAIDRLFATAIDEDLRNRARPTIMAMIGAYFPVGAGLGGFDTVFRVHEPDALLAIQYLNQAHNDFLGIALDAGLPGLLILAVAIGWWGVASAKVWSKPFDTDSALARLGSGVLLLVLVASITDYPARTPMIMAIITFSSVWLARARTTLPQARPDL